MNNKRIHYLADANLDGDIITGLLRLQPDIDFLTSHEANLAGVPDPQVLIIAAQQDRILVTHDKQTMPQHFADYLMSGKHRPGVFLVPQNRLMRANIEDLLLAWRASEPADLIDHLERLPW